MADGDRRKKESGIYLITNEVSGKVYIGSAVDLKHRWSQHCSDLYYSKHRNTHLQRSWNKHGRDVFEFTILEEVPNKNLLIEREQYWIDYHLEQNFELFNICLIAGSNLGRKISDETKQKLSEINSGEKHPRAKLTWEGVNDIREKYKERLTQQEMAESYGVALSTIQHIIENRNWYDPDYEVPPKLGKAAGERNAGAKLTWAKVDKIRELYAQGDVLQKELASQFGVDKKSILRIVNHHSWQRKSLQGATTCVTVDSSGNNKKEETMPHEKKTREDIRLINEEIFLRFLDGLDGFVLLDRENFVYQNAHQSIKLCHTTCGTIWSVKIAKFKNDGSRCPNNTCKQKRRLQGHSLRKRSIERLEALLEELKSEYTMIDSENFVYQNKKQKLQILHLSCKTAFTPSVDNFVRRGTRCPTCSHNHLKSALKPKQKKKKKQPKLHAKLGLVSNHRQHETSIKELQDWLLSENVDFVANTRNIIPPQELDIYIESHKFAIEFNGLYWHSEAAGKAKNYHYNKTRACQDSGIHLFHIFSDEWENRKDIIKSMILHRLNLTKNKIGARQCEIRQIDINEARHFYANAHIASHGRLRRDCNFGLFHDGNLVAALSGVKPMGGHHGNAVEISRFATKQNWSITGAFQRLFKRFKQWAQSYKFEKIISYADLRFGPGTVYKSAGFAHKKRTPLDYWYTDGLERQHRFKYRAQPGIPEKQIAEAAGVTKVYGCGSNLFELKLDNKSQL